MKKLTFILFPVLASGLLSCSAPRFMFQPGDTVYVTKTFQTTRFKILQPLENGKYSALDLRTDAIVPILSGRNLRPVSTKK